MEAHEHDLRRRLGIPDDAQKVLFFGETSHWDPNWLFTSEKYYRLRIRKTLDAVIRELTADPKRIFSIECIFFFQLYWERNPAQQDTLRRLVNEGRLRLTGTGITTPDTLLPETEAILRDYLQGQEWMRAQGLLAEPRLAYLPDNFGHSPGLPAIWRSLGFDRVAVSRIDGMHFIGADYRFPSFFPRPGSSAEALLHEHKTLDFVWRAPDGSEVLCHWNAFTYFQGDMLAHVGIIRWMGLVLGMPWRTGRHIARRVSGFVKALGPVSRTPYLFCPIGCDFNEPIRDLGSLLQRYNRSRYPHTGTYVVNAGLDDYLDLVDCHRASLPTLALDPNPYWMGFYASRPGIKSLCKRTTQKLVLAEKLASRDEVLAPELARQLREGWARVVLSNHHDFITGTSPDPTWHAEQKPWLQQAEAFADAALALVQAPRALPAHVEVPQAEAPHVEAPQALASRPGGGPRAAGPAIDWRLQDGRLTVATPHYRFELATEAGGCLVRFAGVDGEERLSGMGNDLIAYRDSGGLWRMGHEYRGGSFREVERASDVAAFVRASEEDGTLAIEVESVLGGRPFMRRLWLRVDSPVLRMRVTGAARRRLTVTCRFNTVLAGAELTMDVPGGVVTRPALKQFDPTFWAARSFVHLPGEDASGGLAAFLSGPGCVSLSRPGRLEWVTARNAPRERAYTLFPVLAHPASGTEPDAHALDYAVWFTPPGDHQEHALSGRARQILQDVWLPPELVALAEVADAVVGCDRSDVLVAALKAASRGAGLIVRLKRWSDADCVAVLRCAARPIRAAWLCDARERDIAPMRVVDGGAYVPLRSAISSVRLVF